MKIILITLLLILINLLLLKFSVNKKQKSK
jgi:hypothetical protein